MKTRSAGVVLFAGLFIGFSHWADAGPSLPVTKPPVQSTALWTGPMIDPAATNGQWFVDTNGVESVRPNEFYDNVLGGSAGAAAITGYVDSITYLAGPGTPIVAFTIQATIVNDTTLEAEWGPGSNRHGETLDYQELPYVGPLVDTKLAAEFAIADTNKLPTVFTGPYRDRQPYIEAVNEDQRAWYCWNPEDQDPEHNPKGDYFVPTWDFGTIQIGQSASRQLSFVVAPPGLQPAGDARYLAIVASFAATNDILMNRTLSLKISTWIDDLALDAGAQHEEEPPLRLSDVSVFHNQGEEEPYLDFGDAPDAPYPTYLANDGARHVAVPGVHLGALIDVEADGQPDAAATGDDLAFLDDEDGVTFLNALVAGQMATVRVVASVSGYINAWVDFSADGDWADAAENIFSVQAVAAGANLLTFAVPASAAAAKTFARFRFTTFQTVIGYTGLVLDGEVEDYEVEIFDEEEPLLDFGDAWDSSIIPGYPTLLINNGARHAILPGVHLGFRVDPEGDGQPTPSADGDDNNPPAGIDDEDGVSLPAVLVAGSVVQVPVVASTNGYLNAWIDWNANGTWIDAGEQVFLNQPLAAGTNLLPLAVPVPPALVAGGPHSRWRFTTYPPVTPAYTGPEANGEVEDHEVQLEVLDFGDAPDGVAGFNYPTLLANDGARHRIPSAYYIGIVAPDLESDGQPTADADGDDTAGAADEDAVFLPGPLIQGDPAAIIGVTASTNGYLNAWLDFNGDGIWAGPAEQIASDLPLVASGNAVGFAIPAAAQLGPVFGRFRFASTTGLGITGLAADGEVEDHVFTIYQNGPTNAAGFVITNIVHTATNEMTLWWAWESNVTYQAQWASNLLSASNVIWTGWGGHVLAPPYLQIDSNAVASNRFYRVVAPYSPPPP